MKRIGWGGDGLVGHQEFVRGVVTAVVWVLRHHCRLQVDLHYSSSKEEIFCLLNASEDQLLQRAAEVEYKLQTKAKGKEEYMAVSPFIEVIPGITDISNLQEYEGKGADGESIKSVFTLADKVRLVHTFLAESLYVQQLVEMEVIKTHYVPHNRAALSSLGSTWASFSKLLSPQPFHEIRLYFGEQIAMYFHWLDFYCQTMIYPALIGILMYALTWWSHGSWHEVLSIVNSLFLSVWATLYDQFWLRREKQLSWEWGTVGYSDVEDQREDYKGEFIVDPFTLKRKKAKMGVLKLIRQTISYTVATVFIMMVIIAVMELFIYRAILLREKNENGVIYCALLNAVQIRVMNVIYSLVAAKMNDWENHETETEYVDALSVKLFLFRFVNCYVSFFYIAFFKEHYEKCEYDDCEWELALQLGIVFLMNVALNVVELGFPLVDYRLRLWQETRNLRSSGGSAREYEQSLSFTEKQSKMDPYETPMEDYMEMVSQYGYVVMFSSALPLIGVLALFETLLEVRVDSWKLCVLSRRPFPHKCESIGVWTRIVQLVSLMGIITNSALIMFSPHGPHLVSDKPWENFLALESVL